MTGNRQPSAMFVCKKCQKSLSVDLFYRRKGNGKPYRNCKACMAAAQRLRHAANPEKRKETLRRWYLNHRTEQNARVNEWRRRNPEKVRTIQRRAYHRNGNGRTWHRAYVSRLRDRVYAAYGGYVCGCCGVTHSAFLTFDHLNDDGSAMRKVHGDSYKFLLWLVRNDFPKTIGVRCYNCNLGRQLNDGVCPHKQREGSTTIPSGSTVEANATGSTATSTKRTRNSLICTDDVQRERAS